MQNPSLILLEGQEIVFFARREGLKGRRRFPVQAVWKTTTAFSIPFCFCLYTGSTYILQKLYMWIHCQEVRTSMFNHLYLFS